VKEIILSQGPGFVTVSPRSLLVEKKVGGDRRVVKGMGNVEAAGRGRRDHMGSGHNSRCLARAAGPLRG